MARIPSVFMDGVRAEVNRERPDRYNFQILRRPEPSIGYDIALLDEAERLGATIARNREISTRCKLPGAN